MVQAARQRRAEHRRGQRGLGHVEEDRAQADERRPGQPGGAAARLSGLPPPAQAASLGEGFARGPRRPTEVSVGLVGRVGPVGPLRHPHRFSRSRREHAHLSGQPGEFLLGPAASEPRAVIPGSRRVHRAPVCRAYPQPRAIVRLVGQVRPVRRRARLPHLWCAAWSVAWPGRARTPASASGAVPATPTAPGCGRSDPRARPGRAPPSCAEPSEGRLCPASFDSWRCPFTRRQRRSALYRADRFSRYTFANRTKPSLAAGQLRTHGRIRYGCWP